MKIIYGCECPCSNHTDPSIVPVAFLIERNGKEMKVCTKCDFSSDKKIARLFDKESLIEPFFEYDALGAVCISAFCDDSIWEERVKK